jgi:hypothetical protein
LIPWRNIIVSARRALVLPAVFGLPLTGSEVQRWNHRRNRPGVSPSRHKGKSSVGEREYCVQGGSRAGGTVDGDGATQRFDAVLQPDEAGALDGVSPAGAVVTDVEV